ncbi:MAG: sialate O-acetylesterase [Verrucomicrobiales bacterium]
MKRSAPGKPLALAIAALLALAALQSALALDVYIVAGQSNGYRLSSLGQGDPAKPDEHKVYYYGMQCVSEPEESEFTVLESLSKKRMGYGLARSLRELSDSDIIFIQYCRCGSGVWDKSEKGWYPGDDPANGKVHNGGLYGKFLKYLAHAKASAEKDYGLTWNVKGLIWHQGESDSNLPASQYEATLPRLFWRFRHDIDPGLPIVAGHIRELNDGRKAINRALDKLAAKDPLFVVVPSNDLEFAADHEGKPNVHFALEGCETLGRRMAAALAKLIDSP